MTNLQKNILYIVTWFAIFTLFCYMWASLYKDYKHPRLCVCQSWYYPSIAVNGTDMIKMCQNWEIYMSCKMIRKD